MKKFVLILGILIVLLLIGGLSGYYYYYNQIGPVSNKEELILFTVNNGDTYYSIAERLEDAKLIKSKDMYNIYIKLNKPAGLKVGDYYLSPNMDVETIVKTLSGKAISKDISITFKEGKNMRYIAKTISDNTNNKEEDVYNLLKDEAYLKELINEYWFIDDSILNKNIYYSLEGYLYPNTYNFKDKNVSVKEIFKVMLDETEKKLMPYKDAIIKSKYSYHEILTMASIIELEALNINDRNMVSSVFYNRLNINMSLGSDVTTYYASKVDMSDRDLYIQELNDYNAYNTRAKEMAGKLPVGPICNPSISSIEASLNPAKSDYYYFVADKNGKVYYTKTNSEHTALVSKLKKEGLWYTY